MNGSSRVRIALNRPMDAAATEQDAQEAEAALVLSWRYGVLHVAADLLARGCPPRTALEILL